MALYHSCYFIDKTSNTFADNLAVFGLAFVLKQIVDGRVQISIRDGGPAFLVECSSAIQPDWVQHCPFFAAAPFLVTTKNSLKQVRGTDLDPNLLPPSGGNLVIDYEVEKRKRSDYFDHLKIHQEEMRKARLAKKTQPEPFGIPGPHDDWDIFRAINPSSLQAYNSLMGEWWRAQDVFPDLLAILLQYTSSFPNNLNQAEESWAKLCKTRGWASKDATALQLYNPSQGKGSSASKTTWSAPTNLKSFWLLEWLKAAGLYQAAITRLVANSKDRKTYVLVPKHIDMEQHLVIMKDFRQAMRRSETSIKMDILAILRYTQILLKYYDAEGVPEKLRIEFGQPPAAHVQGFQMAHYKDLGNAVATMNIASLDLPVWVKPRDPIDLNRFSISLQEHETVIRSLQEDRGDQFDLLVQYRKFLSGDELDPFFKFTTSYSGFLVSQIERGKFAQSFTIPTLEVLFMNSDEKLYSQIIQNEGFQNVASAIRHSTILPQYQKARAKKGQGERPLVEIRYGLGQQLSRKAAYKDEFLTELAEFAQLYNAENVQIAERERNPMRKNIRPSDLDSIVDLVDRFPSRLVCNLLVAYGYATSGKGSKQAEPDQEDEWPTESSPTVEPDEE
jgi:hypothetical protein